MPNKWFESKPKCVVVCGGKGTRLDPYTGDKAKSMIKVKGKPIIYYIIDYWKKSVSGFVFVLGYKGKDIEDYVKTLLIEAQFIYEPSAQGIARAASLAEEYVQHNFILVLGDCLCEGKFHYPSGFSQGVGVWKTEDMEDIKRSYSIEIKEDKIVKVVEKPEKLINSYCGLGFYFFNRIFFDYILKTLPSKRTNNIEITDVIQTMIASGESIFPVILKGKYLNVTYPEDLKRAEDVI